MSTAAKPDRLRSELAEFPTHRGEWTRAATEMTAVNDGVVRYCAEICSTPIDFISESVRRAQAEGHCIDDDPQLTAETILAANIYHRASYAGEGGPS
ncbi:hypothetical protein [Mycobacterium sp. E3247]|uniref:hypothetical protein n=1 Tax=Mycobacterium sp. E3247 TaxID=1856864 RepID=UPI0007FB899B|nr:hypothetical protein [Mycobacterium sp. E3247]OBH19206.1 hypothetical protein A9X04_08160 [Mycobacterium sp. E3247]